MKKQYVIEGLADHCPLCIEAVEGRAKEKRPPIFQVSCDGGYSGNACGPHLAALIRAGETATAPAAPPKPELPKPETPRMATALPVNGPPK